jgi:hypothetical protein
MKRLSFAFNGARFEILDRPLSWMSEYELVALQARLRRIASARFGHVPSYSYFADTRLFRDKILVLCSDPTGRVDLCFCAMCDLGSVRGRRVVHLGSVFSAAENRGYVNYVYTIGLTYVTWSVGPLRTVYITSLTHTPKIFGAVAEGFENVYPRGRPGEQPSALHLALRDQLIEQYIRPEWDVTSPLRTSESFVMAALRRQTEGNIMFPDSAVTVPKHRKEHFNRHVLGLVDYQRGDEILQVGEARFFTSFPKKVLSMLRNARRSVRHAR